jgi:hypothetical protein
VHMSVTRLRTAKDRQLELGLDRLRADIESAAAEVEPGLVRRLLHLVDREQSARSGWRFVMIEPRLYSDVTRYLARESKRPQAAMLLWAELFAHLADDSNEVLLGRQGLAEAIGVKPKVVSEVVGDLERVGAVYRRRAGRFVKLYVHPSLGTHLKGAVRDRAQAEAPLLRLHALLPDPERDDKITRAFLAHEPAE